jgi:hypothetical protein
MLPACGSYRSSFGQPSVAEAEESAKSLPSERPRIEIQGESASMRLPVPARIIRMAEFGLRHAPPEEANERDPDGWWRRVEREMESAVFAYVPRAAVVVRMRLDEEALEVVVDYALPA